MTLSEFLSSNLAEVKIPWLGGSGWPVFEQMPPLRMG